MTPKWLLAGLLALPLDAMAGGGGGVVLGGSYFPRYGDPDQPYDAPGGLGCIGGVGFGTTRFNLRIGGEGQSCRGRQGVSMGFGGVQLGYRKPVGPIWWSLHSGAGVGVFSDRTPDTGRYDAFFAYLRPEASFGVSWGFTAMEVGFNVMVPFNLAQWVNDGASRGFVTPTVGAQVSFLFGSFYQARQRADAAPVEPEDRPLAIPGPDEPPPQDPPVGADGDLPLAIPADEPPMPASEVPR